LIAGQEAIVSAVTEALRQHDNQKATKTIVISSATQGKAETLFRRIGFVCIAPPDTEGEYLNIEGESPFCMG
jgi:hypothetical protein